MWFSCWGRRFIKWSPPRAQQARGEPAGGSGREWTPWVTRVPPFGPHWLGPRSKSPGGGGGVPGGGGGEGRKKRGRSGEVEADGAGLWQAATTGRRPRGGAEGYRMTRALWLQRERGIDWRPRISTRGSHDPRQVRCWRQGIPCCPGASAERVFVHYRGTWTESPGRMMHSMEPQVVPNTELGALVTSTSRSARPAPDSPSPAGALPSRSRTDAPRDGPGGRRGQPPPGGPSRVDYVLCTVILCERGQRPRRPRHVSAAWSVGPARGPSGPIVVWSHAGKPLRCGTGRGGTGRGRALPHLRPGLRGSGRARRRPAPGSGGGPGPPAAAPGAAGPPPPPRRRPRAPAAAPP